MSNLIKSPLDLLYEKAGIPHMQAGGAMQQAPPQQNTSSPLGLSNILQHILGSGGILDLTPPNPVKGYRSDPKGRHGGKEGIETMPTNLDKTTIEHYVKAMRAGEKYGVPQLPPEYLTNMLLTEGRSDFGFNELNKNNPKATEIAKKISDLGNDRITANFAAALYDKMEAAKRLNKPFSTLWNGTGVNEYGSTGNDYTSRFTSTFPATMHPQNQELLGVVQNAYDAPAPVPMHFLRQSIREEPPSNMPAVNQIGDPIGMARGGSTRKPFHDISKLLIQKYLTGNN